MKKAFVTNMLQYSKILANLLGSLLLVFVEVLWSCLVILWDKLSMKI